MSEEKKEEKVEAKTAAPQAEAKPKVEETPQAAVPPAPATAQAAPTPDKPKEQAPVKKEKPSNCGGCNKSIKKKRWYYRNGKYYCTKRCWQSTLKKEEAPKAAAEAK